MKKKLLKSVVITIASVLIGLSSVAGAEKRRRVRQ